MTQQNLENQMQSRIPLERSHSQFSVANLLELTAFTALAMGTYRFLRTEPSNDPFVDAFASLSTSSLLAVFYYGINGIKDSIYKRLERRN